MENRASSAVTRLLTDDSLESGERARQLLPLVYDELRRLAQRRMADERTGHTLQATALVHEAYLRLVGEHDPRWRDRGHFFAAAAEAMRRILVDQARRRAALKRGGERKALPLDGELPSADDDSRNLLSLDEALAAFEQVDPEKASLVKLRHFAGLSEEQAAQALGISRATAARHWAYARAWLYDEILRLQRGDQ